MQGYIVAIYHGGYCCGMTHIRCFPFSPEVQCPAREALTPERFAENVRISPHHARHFNDNRPAETAGQRLREIVRLSTVIGGGYSNRPSGILEVVLTSVDGTGGTAGAWRPLLTELGFKEVNSYRNSNSGRILHVFHKNTGA